MTEFLYELHYIMNDFKPVFFYIASFFALCGLRTVMD